LAEPQYPDFSNVITRLRNKGIQLSAGLNDSDFDRIRDQLGLEPPPDVRRFLTEALPVGPYFPDWRGDLKVVHDTFIRPIIPDFAFHVERNGFWFDHWGDRPDDINVAVATTKSNLETVPLLFPLGDPAYLKAVPCTPHESGNPVFSVRGPDVLHAGRNIVEYLTWFSEPRETLDHNPTPVFSEDYRQILFWTDVCRQNNV
jgi:hypothetical protein